MSKRGRPPIHGKSRTHIYEIWRSMRRRCEAPDHNSYSYYGGRGISVCDRWQNFAAFDADMGEAYRPGLTLDRIDTNGDYEPANCRWATHQEQVRNRRNTVRVRTPAGEMLLIEAAEEFALGYQCLWCRLRDGRPLLTDAEILRWARARMAGALS